jgi:hypothetical protein
MFLCCCFIFIFSDVYADFEITAVDSKSREAVGSASVGIRVAAVNDPPMAANISFEVYADVPIVVRLSGSDVDSAVGGGAQIHLLPAQGLLYQVFASGAIAFASPILAVPTVLWGLTVGYVYTGPQNATLPSASRKYIASDFFEFQMIDSVVDSIEGSAGRLRSLPGQVSILVLPAIHAIAQPLVTGSEGTETVIQISGGDWSGVGRRLVVEVTALPLHGRLLDPLTGVVLRRGSLLSRPLLPSPQDGYNYPPINVTYVGNPFFFSLPRARHNGSIIPTAVNDYFSFRLKSMDNSYSTIVTQEISLRNRNHETNISLVSRKDHFTVYVLNTHSAGKYLSEVEISDFLLTDRDGDTNLMRLSITTMGGLIDLNPAYVGLLLFNGHYCVLPPDWDCVGTGDNDDILDAVGTAATIRAALNGLVFRSTLSGFVDVVTVTIYDGVGGECLIPSDMDEHTLQTGCHKTTTTFTVEVLAAPTDYEYASPSFVTDQYVPLEYMLLVGIVCIICCCLCCCRKCFINRKDKYLKAGFVDPSTDNASPRTKTKKGRVRREGCSSRDEDALEIAASLRDVSVAVEGEPARPPQDAGSR